MYGYATNETPELLPTPFDVATKFLEKLKEVADDRIKADAKSQVTFDYGTGRIDTFLCSVQTARDITQNDFKAVKRIISGLMKDTAAERALNTDFQVLINPTGRFEVGGPFADCGVTGRKLACDTYGSIGRIAGGVLSGKDSTKVDRSGAYMARKSLVISSEPVMLINVRFRSLTPSALLNLCLFTLNASEQNIRKSDSSKSLSISPMT